MKRGSAIVAALLVSAALQAEGAPAGLDELSLPARLRARMKLVHAALPSARASQGDGEVRGLLGLPPPHPDPSRTTGAQGGVLKSDAAFVSIVIRRWSDEDELAGFEQTLQAGGMASLVKQMQKKSLGDLQFDTELRWPIRYAKTWMTPVGQVLRFAVVGRILDWESTGLPDTTPVLNIVEISLPRGLSSGSGTLVSATRVGFEEDGRMNMVAEASGSTTQSLDGVEIEPARR